MGKGAYGTFGCGSCGPCGIDASTKDVLGQVSVGCQMAEDSMNQIMEHVDDSGMLKLINRCKMRHEELQADANDLLRKAGETPPEPSVAGNVFSWLSAEVKMAMNDDTDTHEAAKLLMDGCNMGIQTLGERMNTLNQADSGAQALARKIIKAEQDLMKELQAYL